MCIRDRNRLSEGQEFELSWEEYGDLILEHAKDNDSEDLVENDIPNDHIKVDKHVDEDVKHRATEKKMCIRDSPCSYAVVLPFLHLTINC